MESLVLHRDSRRLNPREAAVAGALPQRPVLQADQAAVVIRAALVLRETPHQQCQRKAAQEVMA